MTDMRPPSRRVHVRVRGRVQNIGFRAFVSRRAENLELAGWVRNMDSEDQLELEIEGDPSAVETLIDSVRRGPAGARVEDVQISEREPLGHQPPRFTVR